MNPAETAAESIRKSFGNEGLTAMLESFARDAWPKLPRPVRRRLVPNLRRVTGAGNRLAAALGEAEAASARSEEFEFATLEPAVLAVWDALEALFDGIAEATASDAAADFADRFRDYRAEQEPQQVETLTGLGTLQRDAAAHAAEIYGALGLT